VSGTPILEKIRKLAEQRQALWSKSSPLTTEERAAIARLTGELEALWEQQRGELARPRTTPGRRSVKTGSPSSRRRTAA
jgi:hypothetical protein